MPTGTNKTLFICISVLLMTIFLTGTYHKVDDFNFEIINYTYPQNNLKYSVMLYNILLTTR